MSMQLDKDVLLEMLDEKLAQAIILDERRAEAHAEEERQWMKDVQSECKRIASLKSYKGVRDGTAKGGWDEKTSRLSYLSSNAPTCPRLEARPYKDAIRRIKKDRRSTFTVGPTGGLDYLWKMLNANLTDDPETVC